MISLSAATPTTTALRPFDTFDRIVGQRRAVPFLKEIRDGIRLGAHPHPLLFLGRSGHGKTSLSKAFADSIGAEFVRIECGPELRSEHLAAALVGLKSLAVVFCDEFHGMRKRVQEILYSAIDSSVVPKLDRNRLDRCAAPVPIVPFVLIGATNEPGRLLPALRTRMVNVVMDDYSPADLRAIVVQKCRRFLLSLSDHAIDLVVRASGGSPRTIVQILQSVEVTSASWRLGHRAAAVAPHDPFDAGSLDTVPAYDTGDFVGELLAPAPPHGGAADADDADGPGFGSAPAGPSVPDAIVERALTWMGLDLAGLDATGRTLLATIAQHGRATAELLATVLGLDIAYTREHLAELRARQLVTASPGRGWVLTESGRRLVAHPAS